MYIAHFWRLKSLSLYICICFFLLFFLIASVRLFFLLDHWHLSMLLLHFEFGSYLFVAWFFLSIRESVTSGAFFSKNRVGSLCLRPRTHRWSVTFIYCFNWVTVLFRFERCWNGGIFLICFHSKRFGYLSRYTTPNSLHLIAVRCWSRTKNIHRFFLYWLRAFDQRA